MFSSLRERFGTAGLVVAVIALIAAIGGTAIAAGGLTGQQKKEVKKIAKKFAGKPGATGPQGPAGPAGPAGPKGDTGAPGAPGAPGKDGKNGTNGTNGTDGEDGACSDANPECVLPSGATATGAWAFGAVAPNNAAVQRVPISFPMRLEEAPEVHVLSKNGEEKIFVEFNEEKGEQIYDFVEVPECPGTVQEPTADPGVLCLYTHEEGNVAFAGQDPLTNAAFATGAVVGFKPSGPSQSAAGTWAVTAP